MQKSIKEGIREYAKQYDEITNRNIQLLTKLVSSNQIDSSIVKTVSNLLNDKNKSQFSLEPITQVNPRSSANLFTINSSNPQPVLIKGSMMTFENGHSYDLNGTDLQAFITNTQFDREINNLDTNYSFLNEMKNNINYGDKKSTRYYFTKELYSRYQQSAQLPHWGNTIDYNQVQGYAGSGLQGYSRSSSQSYARTYTNQDVFLPSDPDELVDQLKLLYFEKRRK